MIFAACLVVYYGIGLLALLGAFYLSGESFEWPEDVLLLLLAPWTWPIMAVWGFHESIDRGL